MMMLVPLYFQISAHASATSAGAHLMPSVIGNAIGGILTGLIIKRTGRYKLISIVGALASCTAYTLLALRWHGHTSLLESLYIIPGGLGNGIALTASFTALTATLPLELMAIASSGLFLSLNIGCVAGLSLSTALLQTTLRKQLRVGLEGVKHREEVLSRALRDVSFVVDAEGRVGEVIRAVYVRCLGYTHGVSLVGALVALGATFCIRERRL